MLSDRGEGGGGFTCADEEDVAEFHLGALIFEACLEVGERDGRRLETVEVLDSWIRLLLTPAGHVDEDASSYNALLGPRCSIPIRFNQPQYHVTPDSLLPHYKNPRKC